MALTKVTGQVINTSTDVTVGVLTVTNTLAVGGTVSIGGTLTYEDVTNIDSVGLITARNGIIVGSGITLSKDGDVFFTGIATGNGSGLTALNASNISSGTVPTARLGSGTASSSTFLRGDSTFQTVDTDLVSDTSPQLGGDLASNGNDILMADSDQIKLGTGNDLTLYHNGSDSFVAHVNTSGHMRVAGDSLKLMSNADDENYLVATKDGSVELYYDNSKKLETTDDGINIPDGILQVQSTSCNIDLMETGGPSAHTRLRQNNGNFYLQKLSGDKNTSTTAILVDHGNEAVELYQGGNKKLETTSSGVSVTGSVSVTGAATLGNGSGLNFGDTGARIIGETGASGYLRLDTNGGEKVRIDSSGNMGLGTDSVGTTNGAIGLKFGMKSDNNNAITFETTNATTNRGLLLESRLTGRSGGETFAQIHMKQEVGGQGGLINFYTAANGAATTEQMRISSAGYVTKPNMPAFLINATGMGTKPFGQDHSNTTWDINYLEQLPVFGQGLNSPGLTVIHNNGSHLTTHNFTTSGGSAATYVKFTAPVTGYYLFFISACPCKSTVGDWWGFGLNKNFVSNNSNGDLDYYFSSMNQAHDANQEVQMNGTTVVYMNQDDYVIPYARSCNRVEMTDRIVFGGHLLF